MKGKMIIEADGVTDEEALAYAYQVVKGGRISGDGACYCYMTTFEHEDKSKVHVYASRNKKSDRLQVRMVK